MVVPRPNQPLMMTSPLSTIAGASPIKWWMLTWLRCIVIMPGVMWDWCRLSSMLNQSLSVWMRRMELIEWFNLFVFVVCFFSSFSHLWQKKKKRSGFLLVFGLDLFTWMYFVCLGFILIDIYVLILCFTFNPLLLINSLYVWLVWSCFMREHVEILLISIKS